MNNILRRTKTTFLLKQQVNKVTRRVLLFAVMSLSLGTALIVVNAYSKRDANPETPVDSGEVKPASYEGVNSPTVTLAQGENLQVKLVTLTSRGFDPDELITSNGRFILNIENISGFSDTFIALSNNRNAVLQTAQMQRGKVDWVKAFDLQPGNYVLTESSHPEWKCTITVKPKQ